MASIRISVPNSLELQTSIDFCKTLSGLDPEQDYVFDLNTLSS